MRLYAFGVPWASLTLHCTAPTRLPFSCLPFFKLLAENFSRSIERAILSDQLHSERFVADQTLALLRTEDQAGMELIEPERVRKTAAVRLAACVSHFLPVFSADAAIICLRNDFEILSPNGSRSNQELNLIGFYLMQQSIKSLFISRCCERDCPQATRVVNGKSESVFRDFSGLLHIPLSASGDAFISFLRRQNLEFARSFHVDTSEASLEDQPNQFPCNSWAVREENLAKLLQVVCWSFVGSLQERESGLRNEQLKTIMLANVSHEVRTPLNAIVNFLEMMMDDTSKETFLTYWTYAHDASRCAGMFDVLAKNRNLEFSVFINDSFPDLTVLCDQSKLRQILTNLLGNAVKYTEKGFIRLFANATVSGESHIRLELRVQDSGMGIPQDKLISVFNAFERIEQVGKRRQIEGTGLGLAICHKFASLLNGSLTLDSTEGVGSIFTFTAELALYRASASKPDRLLSQTSSDTHPMTSLNVLVAENNAVNQHVLMSRLAKDGHHVCLVENGEEAVDAIAQYVRHQQLPGNTIELASTGPAKSTLSSSVGLSAMDRIDLVLMDIEMPALDGLEATRRIRKLERQFGTDRIPIIAVTGSVSNEDSGQCILAGMDGFVGKPIDYGLLRAMIRHVKDGSWQEQRAMSTYRDGWSDSASQPVSAQAELKGRWLASSGWLPLEIGNDRASM
ncbi:hypothetical protein BC831DRAFT_435696 [Entophlyctis helioformis]|nr:hypothetical protein BC831DRAFT_435696 [Entophlyctis helioformis]